MSLRVTKTARDCPISRMRSCVRSRACGPVGNDAHYPVKPIRLWSWQDGTSRQNTTGGATVAVTSTPDKLTLTVEEAAAVLGIGRTLAFELARTGQLPTIRLGRRLLVPRA